MKFRTKLVALVGADGVGKSTVSELLAKELIANGYSARCIGRWDIVGNPNYPESDFLVNDVPHIRRCVAMMPLNSRYLFLLWSMSLALAGGLSRETEGEILILDGYWMKHAASEMAYGSSNDWLLATSRGLPHPDLVFNLCLAPEDAWSRKGADVVPYECGMDPSCSRSSFLTHQRSIKTILDGWAKEFGWYRIDVDQDISQVVETARSMIVASLERECR